MRDFQLPGRSAVFAANGICATSHPHAARIAIETLQRGGNAVDAAIAGSVALGICEPQMTGIGGDCFALIKPAGTEEIVALNGSGRAPKGLDAANLRADEFEAMPIDSAHAVTVPGAIDAFCTLAEHYGLIGIDSILAPAIDAAENGVPVAPRVARDWAATIDTLQGAARLFFLDNGKAPVLGQTFRHPMQAEVLRRIAKVGRRAFYEGEIAEDMVASLNALGGTHTAEDFARTECMYTTPIRGTHKGIELVEHPPNGQGATAILMNNILSHFDLASMDPWGSQRAHVETEAAKLAYDARNRLIADPDHTTRLEHMLAPDTAAQLAALIDMDRAMAAAKPLTEDIHRDTVYLTVIDKDRMAVSLIYSIYHGFGSGLASDKFGILFQNRGAGFTLEEGHPNEAKGGKRPMHTIIPGMLCEGGRVTTAFGVMGGAYQPNGHARMVTNFADFGLDLQGAVDAPRSFFEDGEMKVEKGYSDQVRQELSDLGHPVVIPDVGIGGAQMIRIDHEMGVLEGASDPRKDGCALGY